LRLAFASFFWQELKNLRSSLPALSAMLLMAFAVPSYADVIKGMTLTMGGWHNANGQAVINSFGKTSTAMTSTAMTLGQWLNMKFGNLFAASQTNAQVAAANAQVAADFQTAFSVLGLQGNTYVKAFTVALSCYASTIGLGFDSTAAQVGFIGTVDGLGNQTYNVGNNGAAFGVPNGTPLTVFQVMAMANANYNPVTGLFYGGDATLTNDLNNVLDWIDQKGDIR
jgi:hypothetical protein